MSPKYLSECADEDHNDVSELRVGKTGVSPKLTDTIDECFANAQL